VERGEGHGGVGGAVPALEPLAIVPHVDVCEVVYELDQVGDHLRVGKGASVGRRAGRRGASLARKEGKEQGCGFAQRIFIAGPMRGPQATRTDTLVPHCKPLLEPKPWVGIGAQTLGWDWGWRSGLGSGRGRHRSPRTV
jgi:hypothetical protein